MSLDGLVALIYLAVGYPFLVVGIVICALVAFYVREARREPDPPPRIVPPPPPPKEGMPELDLDASKMPEGYEWEYTMVNGVRRKVHKLDCPCDDCEEHRAIVKRWRDAEAEW